MGRKLMDLTGKHFGRLTVIERVINDAKGKSPKWLCMCDAPCNNKVIVTSGNLTTGNTKSCGCARIKHGANKRGLQHPVYTIWVNMKNRCNDTNNTFYKNYGGRGIKVCKRWNNSFECFRDYVLSLPNCPVNAQVPGEVLTHTLERKNNNGNYEPGNVCWATRKEQANNRRNNIIVTVDNKDMTLAEAVAYKGMASYDTIYSRVQILKWPIDRALSTPGR